MIIEYHPIGEFRTGFSPITGAPDREPLYRKIQELSRYILNISKP